LVTTWHAVIDDWVFARLRQAGRNGVSRDSGTDGAIGDIRCHLGRMEINRVLDCAVVDERDVDSLSLGNMQTGSIA